MALIVDNVTYEYAAGTSLAHTALDGISLSIEPGQLVFVIGQTGSGKSTLLRIASGLLKPGSGKVLADGAAVAPGVVGMVFQQPEAQLFSDTVIEDVGFGPANLGHTPEEAAALASDALRQVGLDPGEIGGRSPFALSGGQARRVAIAGVLAMEPAYLLLDEPSAGLDGQGRRFVHALLEELLAKGCGIVVVSHDIDEFLGIADQVVLLDEGRVAWSGPADHLIAAPRKLFGKAHLDVPAILQFQEDLGCMDGSYTLDVERVARWALEGFPVPGPLPHAHDGGAHVHDDDTHAHDDDTHAHDDDAHLHERGGEG